MIPIPEEAFKNGLLDPLKHNRLILELERFCERCGIAPKWFWTPAVGFLNQNLVSYLRKCLVLAQAEKPIYGICFVGKADMTDVMSSMAGVLMRVFVDGRLMSAQTIADLVLDGEQPEATVLFCPNFFATEEYGRFDTKKISALGDILTYRVARGLQTVIHVDDMAKFKVRFGGRVVDLVEKSMIPMTTAGDEQGVGDC
jgi:hypothetical protein